MFLDNILITGGCGFLGVSLIKKLLSLGSKNIRLIDNLSVGKKKDLRQVCEFIEIDANNLKGPPNALEFIVGDIRDLDLAMNLLRIKNGISQDQISTLLPESFLRKYEVGVTEGLLLKNKVGTTDRGYQYLDETIKLFFNSYYNEWKNSSGNRFRNYL